VPDALVSIRQRLSAQIEAAAQELEAELSRDTITRAAYNQGRADRQRELLVSIAAWRDQLPPGRQHAQLRTALEAIHSTLEPT
jgi:hypothetical protein